MKKARAMYIPAGGKKAVWGPVDQNVLPEGYPYKAIEKTALVENLNVNPGYHEPSVYEADFEFTAGQSYTVEWSGETHECVAVLLDGEIGTIGNLYLLEAGDNTGEPFVMYAYGGNLYVKGDGDAVTLSISGITETIHPMAPEFLPAGVGGGRFVVTVTEDGDTVTADKTFAEIDAAYSGGNTLVCVLPIADNTISSYHYLDMAIPGTCYRFVSVTPGTSAPVLTAITITDGSVQKELTVLAVKS